VDKQGSLEAKHSNRKEAGGNERAEEEKKDGSEKGGLGQWG
jgi:hypothetical protein